MKFIKIILIAVFSISLMNIIGCASVSTALEHKNLEVASQQSETIFLDSVSDRQKTVHISIKNTSDKEILITPQVIKAIRAHGYKVVRNPNHAHYLLQANILKVGKMNKSAARSALGGGYGSVLSGAITGTALGSLSSSTNTMVGAGVVGGLVSMAADSLIKDVNFTMITDIQVSERVNGFVKERTKSNLSNGSSTQTVQDSSRQTKFQRYRTRVVSNADQVNLKFADARPALEHSLAKVISGIF